MNAAMPERDLPTVSVIVPVFGDITSLPQLVRAIQDQDYPKDRVEFLVVDNHATPTIGDLGDGVQIVHEPRPGSYSARNAGARQAIGDVLAFTDADCLPTASWLSAGITDLIGAKGRITGGGVNLTVSERPTGAELYEQRYALQQAHYVAQGFCVTANLFVRRQDFALLDGFDERLYSGGDKEFGLRATTTGFTFSYCGQAFVVHPARQTLRQVLSKRRRLVAGAAMNARNSGTPLRVRGQLTNSPRALGAGVQEIMRDASLRLPDRMKLLTVMGLVFTSTIWWTWRYRLWHGPQAPRT